MNSNNEKKTSQLGMPFGTACNKLRKNIMFMLLRMQNLNFCHRCKEEIKSEFELSIEHKEPWLDSDDPIKNFFDLNNIAFSHLSCNSSTTRQPRKGEIKHPSTWSYKKGCRCNECVNEMKKCWNKYDKKRRDIGS